MAAVAIQQEPECPTAADAGAQAAQETMKVAQALTGA
jgi:hypothetical protein